MEKQVKVMWKPGENVSQKEIDLHTKCVVDVDANKVILNPVNTNLSKGDARCFLKIKLVIVKVLCNTEPRHRTYTEPRDRIWQKILDRNWQQNLEKEPSERTWLKILETEPGYRTWIEHGKRT
uniref:Kinesin family member 13B n=1 Tax=Myotis myotis TaxID=51298 RepID=A0A7J7XI03_MYOMY|nr:kinesin family member 13B [Myotis myotis]